MKFIFPGPPIPKKRHRSCIRNAKIATYDEQKMEAQNAKIKLKLMILDAKFDYFKELTQLARAEAFDVNLMLYLPFPKSFSKRKIKAILDGVEPNIANKKPDIDNLEKFYFDVGKGILYKDDALIVSVNKKKCYDLNPRTEFTIYPYPRPVNE